ncbi:Unknown protein sequence [Pseudomonas syringae pv. maculicola]|nr:Unknown protein sequence [Pseudomonas syringae pv. maculicola]
MDFVGNQTLNKIFSVLENLSICSSLECNYSVGIYSFKERSGKLFYLTLNTVIGLKQRKSPNIACINVNVYITAIACIPVEVVNIRASGTIQTGSAPSSFRCKSTIKSQRSGRVIDQADVIVSGRVVEVKVDPWGCVGQLQRPEDSGVVCAEPYPGARAGPICAASTAFFDRHCIFNRCAPEPKICSGRLRCSCACSARRNGNWAGSDSQLGDRKNAVIGVSHHRPGGRVVRVHRPPRMSAERATAITDVVRDPVAIAVPAHIQALDIVADGRAAKADTLDQQIVGAASQPKVCQRRGTIRSSGAAFGDRQSVVVASGAQRSQLIAELHSQLVESVTQHFIVALDRHDCVGRTVDRRALVGRKDGYHRGAGHVRDLVVEAVWPNKGVAHPGICIERCVHACYSSRSVSNGYGPASKPWH